MRFPCIPPMKWTVKMEAMQQRRGQTWRFKRNATDPKEDSYFRILLLKWGQLPDIKKTYFFLPGAKRSKLQSLWLFLLNISLNFRVLKINILQFWLRFCSLAQNEKCFLNIRHRFDINRSRNKQFNTLYFLACILSFAYLSKAWSRIT